jgi:glycosyltransferase involved in cell wall biosynthesis
MREFGVAARKVTYVPNAVVALSKRELAHGLPDGCDGARLVGRVCRLQPEKGLDVFLRAAVRIARGAPDVRFLIVGEGPVRHRLETLGRRLGIAERVHFLGHRTDARAIIAALEILVVSSLSDGSPLVVLEAMASATPILATRTGGIPDQVRDGLDGLLVAPGDVHALAGGMRRLLDDPDAARRLAVTAQRRARSRFRYDAMVAGVERAYRVARERRAGEIEAARGATARRGAASVVG